MRKYCLVVCGNLIRAFDDYITGEVLSAQSIRINTLDRYSDLFKVEHILSYNVNLSMQ